MVSVDPGDMRTVMHQQAFPGEDISDRPTPDVTLPFWAWLLAQDHMDISGVAFPGAGRTVEDTRMKRSDLIFPRPPELQAAAPPDVRGIARDEVRLMVSTPDGHRHAHFYDLPSFLHPGDLLVVNHSATLPASLPGEGIGW